MNEENKFDAESAFVRLENKVSRDYRRQQSAINALEESHELMKTVQDELLVPGWTKRRYY